MELTLGQAEIAEELKTFLEDDVLKEKVPDLDGTTPLLELGILNSLSTARVIAFIRERYGLYVPAEKIVGSNFQSLNTIAELVTALSGDPYAHV